ncbi:hypothetical protein JCM10212_003603 [Sporobolomyces blumeae]
MRSALALLALGAVGVSAVAVPEDIPQMKRNIIARQSRNLVKRNSLTQGADDATILQFALILEHLEDTFYSEALSKFSQADFEAAGYSGVYPVLEQVAADEAAHVAFLTAGLKAAGATPVSACNYTFPYTDVASFLALSQVIEGVGVSAYLGAAGDISSSEYLTDAASILTVEARHNSFIRLLNQYTPNPQPMDTPLSASNVVGIVTPFFTSCPKGSGPTIPAPPSITVTPQAATLGGTINVKFANESAVDMSQTLYCGFASGIQAAFTKLENGSCQVPTQNITTGQTYVLITKGPSLLDASEVAGAGIIDTTPKNTTVVIAANSMNSSSASSTGSADSSMGTGSSAKAGAQNAKTNGAVSPKMAGAAVLSVVAGALSLVF